MTHKIASVNCQGLGDFDKSRDVFNYLRKMDPSVYCLQDTHLSYIRAQCSYECFINVFINNAQGVTILFKGNFEYKMGRIIYFFITMATSSY